MRIYAIFGRRVDSSFDQRPELIEAVDEYTNDENPDYILEKLAEAMNDRSFASTKLFEIDIGNQQETAIEAALDTNIKIDATDCTVEEMP